MAKAEDKKAKAHPDLGELDISVTEFGEIKGSLNIDKINKFLDKNVDDKKLSKDQIEPSTKK
jgi:hypothetical protein